MESKFIPTLQVGNGYTYLKLKGILDEDNLLNNLLSQIQGRLLLIDMAEMERINSCGVRDWVNWLNQIQALGIAVILLKCSPVIVSQANMVANFASDAFIHSFYAPYIHPDTGEEQNVLLFTEEIRQNQPIKAPKIFNENGDELEFDEFEESFFAFINDKRQLSYQIPSDIQAVIEYFLPEAKTRQPVVQNKANVTQQQMQQSYSSPKMMNAGPAYANAYAQQNMGGFGQNNAYAQPNPYASQQQPAANPYAPKNPYASQQAPAATPYAKPNPYNLQETIDLKNHKNSVGGAANQSGSKPNPFPKQVSRPIPQPQQPIRHEQPPLPGQGIAHPAPYPASAPKAAPKAAAHPVPRPDPVPPPSDESSPIPEEHENPGIGIPAYSEPRPAPEPISPLAAQAQASQQIRLPQANQKTIQSQESWLPPAPFEPEDKKRRAIIWGLILGIAALVIVLIIVLCIKHL